MCECRGAEVDECMVLRVASARCTSVLRRSDGHLARALEGRAEGLLGDETVPNVDAHAILVHPPRPGLRVVLQRQCVAVSARITSEVGVYESSRA